MSVPVSLSRWSKPLSFVAAALPLVLLLAGVLGVAGRDLGPNPIREMLHVTGKTALNLLMIGLMITPLHRLTRSPEWLRPRRLIGLWAFAYAVLHGLIYAALELEWALDELARELVKRPYILVGTAAWLALLPLAVTSTDRWMRRLGRRWQHLHRLVYPATALGIWHYAWQVKLDLLEPLLYALGLGLLLAARRLVRR